MFTIEEYTNIQNMVRRAPYSKYLLNKLKKIAKHMKIITETNPISGHPFTYHTSYDGIVPYWLVYAMQEIKTKHGIILKEDDLNPEAVDPNFDRHYIQ